MSSVEYHYPVIGRKGTGGVFDRLPIQTLGKDQPYQFALFILAFSAIQQRSDAPHIEPAATFMEIASIHGKPYVEWAGDRNKDTSADYSPTDKKDTNPVPSRFGGYCNHGAVVFPTWHRPYVMLIEQSIGNIAEQLAHDIETNNPGENGVWIKAAKELRFPYWDWADKDVPENGLPPVLYEDKIEIMAAGGKKRIVNNPLLIFLVCRWNSIRLYRRDGRLGQVAYFSKWQRTYRHADSTPNPEGSHIDSLQTAFKAGAKDLRRRVAQLFTFNDDQNSAITHVLVSARIIYREMDFVNSGSLEGVHDTVHILLGGNGQMSYPDYAGFDPIFFLHHSNVDRLCMYISFKGVVLLLNPPSGSVGVVLHTEYWMGSGYEHDNEQYPWTQARGTYAQVYNEQLLPDGPLQPFRTEQGDYWTSTQARFLDEQGYPKYYSFPEFEGIKVDKAATSSQERAAARKRVQAYYDFDPQTKAKQVASHAWKHLPVPNKEDPAVPSDHTVIPNYRTFVVHVKLVEHAYNRSYSFQLHHKGNVHSSPQLVGTITVFARPDNSPCKACAMRREAGSVVRGMIPIPPELIDSIIKSNGGAESGVSFNQTLAHIKGEFVGKLVDATGSQLAGAEGGVETTQVPQHRATSRRVTPVEISLVSAAVAEHVEDKARPVHLCDWQLHDGIFNGGWLATHKDSE
ncbi:common central domain of tyrosinase-domain-containing protein [Suillus subalutaceus]|uniref:common central domain of tyrosinase-domain-containing protein n=1 Tax=Suillus subalutaceus TaxID=48586 RepID=UPI001B8860B0|nr:common central domain of tyrosinase-domain-containing protein [Suillus subalutaceus]KAG1857734.1 common central domain of tyrosinase-domain-containing protein [Suillus subalutaceus]